MSKLVEFAKKAVFYVRVLSGYEERRIRAFRMQLQKRLQDAETKKAALKNVPEQLVLSEVRRMVEHMQSMNKQMEDTEAAIQERFKSIDAGAEMLVKMKLQGDEEAMKQIAEAMRDQALFEQAEAEKIAELQNAESHQQTQGLLNKAAADRIAEIQNAESKKQAQIAESLLVEKSQM